LSVVVGAGYVTQGFGKIIHYFNVPITPPKFYFTAPTSTATVWHNKFLIHQIVAISFPAFNIVPVFVIVFCQAVKYFYYHPINIELFTGGKPIIMGGMTIVPLVKIYALPQYFWQVPLMIYFFLSLTMIYPLIRLIRRIKNAI
jgi:hypothetical protein